MKFSKVFWAISLLLAAAVLVLLGLGVNLVEGISAWRIVLGVLVLYCALDILFTAKPAKKKVDAIIPFALLYCIEKSVIEKLCDVKLIEGWIIFVASILVAMALHILIPNGQKYSCAVKYTEKCDDGEIKNTLSGKEVYFDATKPKHTILNTMGGIDVYFQNTENIPDDAVITLDIKNTMGGVDIHVPSDWIVEDRLGGSISSCSIRPNKVDIGVKLILTGGNTMGAVEVI